MFVIKNDKLSIQFLRYLFVSGFSFLIDFGTLYVCTDIFHIHYLVASILGYTLGLITNYLISVHWIFHSRSMKNKGTEFLVFTLIGFLGMALNTLILWIWAGIFKQHYLFGRILSAGIGYLWKFIARKLILFSGNNISQQSDAEDLNRTEKDNNKGPVIKFP